MTEYELHHDAWDDGTEEIEITDPDGEVVYKQSVWSAPGKMPPDEVVVDLVTDHIGAQNLSRAMDEAMEMVGSVEADP